MTHPDDVKTQIAKALGIDATRIHSLFIEMEAGLDWPHVTIQLRVPEAGGLVSVFREYELRPINDESPNP